jgi:predicted Zn-dependent peptidase
VSALDDTFGKQPSGIGPLPPPEPPVVPRPAPRLVLVDVPGNSFATIVAGATGPQAGSADEEAAILALQALADSTLGRLTKRLRADLGYTSQVGLWHLLLRSSGYLSFSARLGNETVGSALKETDAVLRALGAQGPSEEEATGLRERRLFSTVSSFETPAEAALAYGDWLAAGQAPDRAVTRNDRIAQVTPQALKGAAARYLDADGIHYVVAGDAATLKAPLEALGWGPLELRSPAGAVLPAGVEAQAKRR